MGFRARPGDVFMSDEIRLSLQVIGSLVIIFGVLWWMWRVPGEAVSGSLAAAVLAFCSVWIGLAAIGLAGWLWWSANPGPWAVASVLVWAAGLSCGLLALWTYRHTPASTMSEQVLLQRLQARVGVALGLVAVAMWYVFMIARLSTLTVSQAEQSDAAGVAAPPSRHAAELAAAPTYDPGICRLS